MLNAAGVNGESANHSVMSLKELQSWWEVPTIAHFCSLFREAFNLLEFSIEDLEEALINVGNDTFTGSSPLILQLVINLLQGCLTRQDINLSNYDRYLKEFLTKKYYEEKRKPNVWGSSPDFLVMPLRMKVDVLYDLCHYRLDALDVVDSTKNLESDSLRLEPLGTDQAGAVYWYFNGTRLYQEIALKKNREKKKETAKVRKRKVHKRRRGEKNAKKEEKEPEEQHGNAEWQIVCSTEEEWKQFAEKFAKSQNRSEKALHKRIVNELLPEIANLIEEREKILKKRLLEMAPKRVSQRIEKFKQQEEEKVMKQLEEDQRVQEELRARRAEDERKRKQREVKERELRALERMQMKEDRARRANRRRENGEYQVVRSGRPTCVKDEPIYRYDTNVGRVHHKPSMTHGTRGSTSYFETNEAQRMYKVLQAVQKHKDSWPFRDPITERYAPGYFTCIEHPMDLSTIGKKLQHGEYKDQNEFEKDFILMFDNCRKYNGALSEYTRIAESVKSVFDNVMKNVFPLRANSPVQKQNHVVKKEIKSPGWVKIESSDQAQFSTNRSTVTNRITPLSTSSTMATSTTAANTQSKPFKTHLSGSVVTSNSVTTVKAASSTCSTLPAPSSKERRESILRTSLSQAFQKKLPIRVISTNPTKTVQLKLEPPKMPTLINRNGTHPIIQRPTSNANALTSTTTKYVMLNPKETTGKSDPQTPSKAATLSKMTVIQVGKERKLVVASDSVISSSNGQVGNLVAAVKTTPKSNGVPIKRVYRVVNNGGREAIAVVTKGEKRPPNSVLKEPEQKRFLGGETVLNEAQSIVEQQQQSQLQPAHTVIDPSHAGYCIQVPTVTNCTQQQILTLSPEGQQYEINNGSSLESILQPTYIQTQVQTQPMQYNYIDLGQLQQQQQQLVIPVNSQIVYTTSDVVTNVGSMLQVYPNMVFQVSSPIQQQQQQQIFPVQYYEAIPNGVLS